MTYEPYCKSFIVQVPESVEQSLLRHAAAGWGGDTAGCVPLPRHAAGHAVPLPVTQGRVAR